MLALPHPQRSASARAQLARHCLIFCAMLPFFVFVILLWFGCTSSAVCASPARIPLVVNTWPFLDAAKQAWQTMLSGGTAVDSVVAGCSQCEVDQCDGSVGFGGSPDENGETTLDAMIIDAETHRIGAVGALRNVKNAIRVARAVMEHTDHTLLVGDQATSFALSMGFSYANLSTDSSIEMWKTWKSNNCQPNYRRAVSPDHKKSCGPYKPKGISRDTADGRIRFSHDTIGMVAIAADQSIAAGTSTNGMTWKVPGRVGDSPIPGAGAYADRGIGGCGATGNGDIMMRFLPCFLAVEQMRMGKSPSEAASISLERIAKFYPYAQAAIVLADVNGNHGGACLNWNFSYTAINPSLDRPTVFHVNCTTTP